MHEREMQEYIKREFEGRGHYSATPDGKLTAFAEMAVSLMKIAEASGYQRGMSEAAKHMR